MFLATTALEDFWDNSEALVFLGEWCKLFNRRHIWMNKKFVDLPPVWKDTAEIENGIRYCNNIYERLLNDLTVTLNRIHGDEKNVDYYRMILGNWLLHFIHQYYDKYLTLSLAFEIYPNIIPYY